MFDRLAFALYSMSNNCNCSYDCKPLIFDQCRLTRQIIVKNATSGRHFNIRKFAINIAQGNILFVSVLLIMSVYWHTSLLIPHNIETTHMPGLNQNSIFLYTQGTSGKRPLLEFYLSAYLSSPTPFVSYNLFIIVFTDVYFRNPNKRDDTELSSLTEWPSYDPTNQQYIRLVSNHSSMPIESYYVADRIHFWNSVVPVLTTECEAVCSSCKTCGITGGTTMCVSYAVLITVLVILQLIACSEHPLQPYFAQVKEGFTGVCIISRIFFHQTYIVGAC